MAPYSLVSHQSFWGPHNHSECADRIFNRTADIQLPVYRSSNGRPKYEYSVPLKNTYLKYETQFSIT